jgi:hypothetical protein
VIWLATHMFVLCLLSFIAGTVASALLLVRPILLQEKANDDARARLKPVPRVVNALPAQRVESPKPQPVENPKSLSVADPAPQVPRGADRPAFASRATAHRLGVSILVSPVPNAEDPARSPVPRIPSSAPPPDAESMDTEEETSQDESPAFTETTLRGHDGASQPSQHDASALAVEQGAPDAAHIVKGNTRSMRYHTPDSPYYSRTKPGAWFRTIQEAEEAGFSAWNERVRSSR